jgi:putative ATP-dependent endonuclease of the OLD family
MALHIARVEIENFRNFRRIVIDPFPATAVIVGENNVGKTNLLFALRLLLDPDLPDNARRLRPEDFFDGSGGPSPSVAVRIAVELADFGDDPRACATLNDCYVSDDPPRARLEYRFEPRQAVDDGEATDTNPPPGKLTTADYDWQLLGGPSDAPVSIRVEPRRYIGLKVLPALRDASDELTRRRSPLRDLLDRVTPDAATLQGAAADISAAMDTLLEDDALGDLQGAIRLQTTDMVGPALQVSPTLGIAPTVPDQLLRQIRLFTDVDRRRGLNDTSVGTANVLYLALLMEAVRRRRVSNEQVSTVLGVEEPEAHLHVQVQRRLFGYLLRHEPALLLTSHSPHIAAVAPLPSLVLLRATTSGTLAATTAGAGLSAMQRADLERYLDATRAELLFARLAILVEGDAERHVLPALASAAGFDLDEYGISVISVQGTDFGPFRRLLGSAGLGVPHLVVTDGDRTLDPYPATSDGLLRALRLVNSEAARAVIEVFPEHPRRDGHIPLGFDVDFAARKELIGGDVFVGDATLEVDLARLMPDPMRRATEELLGEQAAEAQGRCITTISADEDDHEVRREFLSRIETIGKGRFAQRLAAHLIKVDVASIREAFEVGHRTGYVLQALDRASQLARQRPLVDTVEPRLEA